MTAKISGQASELDKAMTRIKELQSIIASGKAELKLSRQQSMDLGFEKSRLESNLEEHEAKLRKEVTDLKSQLKTAEHAMATQKKKMGARIETLMESLKTEVGTYGTTHIKLRYRAHVSQYCELYFK